MNPSLKSEECRISLDYVTKSESLKFPLMEAILEVNSLVTFQSGIIRIQRTNDPDYFFNYLFTVILTGDYSDKKHAFDGVITKLGRKKFVRYLDKKSLECARDYSFRPDFEETLDVCLGNIGGKEMATIRQPDSSLWSLEAYLYHFIGTFRNIKEMDVKPVNGELIGNYGRV